MNRFPKLHTRVRFPSPAPSSRHFGPAYRSGIAVSVKLSQFGLQDLSGRSSTNSASSGIHHFAILSSQKARRYRAVSLDPLRRTATTSGRSSHCGCAIAITAASVISGWVGFNRFAPAVRNYSCRQDRPHSVRLAGSPSSATRTSRPPLLPRAHDPRKRLRARREKDDKPEVDDEQSDRKGCYEPYD